MESEKNEAEGNGQGQGLRPIRETLSRFQSSAAGKSNGVALNPAREKSTGDCECRECGNTFTGTITIFKFLSPAGIKPRPPREFRDPYCPGCKAKREAEEETARKEKLTAERRQTVERWRKFCGIPDYLASKTFDNFERSLQLDACNDALAWARSFNLESPKGYPSLIFYSATAGLGKTHFMVAIANYLFDNWSGAPSRMRSPVIFVKGPQLVRRIRYTYNLPEDDHAHEREEDVYREITGVPLLLLDDVGKETPSKFTRETYWYIIDERVTNGLPVIITSRLPLEGGNSLEELMGEDTVDRLYGMTRGEVTEMTGKSYRRSKQIP